MFYVKMGKVKYRILFNWTKKKPFHCDTISEKTQNKNILAKNTNDVLLLLCILYTGWLLRNACSRKDENRKDAMKQTNKCTNKDTNEPGLCLKAKIRKDQKFE